MSSVGESIVRLRKEAGVSRAELARAARVSSEYIRKLENGEVPKPSFQYLARIADALGVPVSQLTGEESERERAVRIAEEALDYGTREPRGEDAVPMLPRPGSETYQQMIRRHFPNATPEEFAELQLLVERFMQHNIQEMRAINQVGDAIIQLAKERSGEGGEEEEESEEAKRRKPFQGKPEEFHGERFLEVLRQAY